MGRPMGPPHPAEAGWGAPRGILFPPLLLARATIAFGPQVYACREERIANVKVGKKGNWIDSPNRLCKNIGKNFGREGLIRLMAQILGAEKK